MKSVLKRNKITQICVLVRDVESRAKEWAKFLQVEMPDVTMSDKYEITKAVYRGKPCYGRIWQAIFDLENIQLEIVGPVDGEPSYWRDYLDEHGEGLHHVAFVAEDMDEAIQELAEEGYEMIQRGSWPGDPKGGQYAYMTTKDRLGCALELLCF